MITLDLQGRETDGTVEVNMEVVRRILDMPDVVAGRQFVKMFKALEATVHDSFWLSTIINWSPQEGLPLTTIAPWLKLAERVAKLDINYEGPFVLSSGQADLIYNRLEDPNFKLNGLSPALAAFLLMFFKAIDKHPKEMTKEVMFEDHSKA